MRLTEEEFLHHSFSTCSGTLSPNAPPRQEVPGEKGSQCIHITCGCGSPGGGVAVGPLHPTCDALGIPSRVCPHFLPGL